VLAVILVKCADGIEEPVAAGSAMPFEGLYRSDGSKTPWSEALAVADDHDWKLNHVATSTACRGQGLSSKLLREVENEIVQRCAELDGSINRKRVRMITRTIEKISGPF